jgi:hypothetical protein
VFGLQPSFQLLLRPMGFGDRDDGFALDVDSDEQTSRRVVENWQRHGEEVVLQAAGLSSVPWADALRAFTSAVNGSGTWWFLFGSAALAARGLDAAPGDLDIATDRHGIEALKEILGEHLLSPVQDTRGWLVCEYTLRAFLHARIEIVGNVRDGVDDPQPRPFGPEAASRLERVAWEGLEVCVAPLDLQLIDELSRGRRHQAAQILRAMETV